VREFRSHGSVRGALSNGRPYRKHIEKLEGQSSTFVSRSRLGSPFGTEPGRRLTEWRLCDFSTGHRHVLQAHVPPGEWRSKALTMSSLQLSEDVSQRFTGQLDEPAIWLAKLQNHLNCQGHRQRPHREG